ncbi:MULTISPECIES: hypothetical protein [unclassified Streptomyces]|uniref:hypothetical protein n=1 Tax=unclassified Streptomyces TaxID=2593676 RepID=UPI0033DC0DA0
MAEPSAPSPHSSSPAEHSVPSSPAAHSAPSTPSAVSGLYPPDARDKLTLRLQNAVNGFVDSPRAAVESADGVLEEAIADLTHLLTERRRTLRTSWEALPAEGVPGEPPPPGGARTTAEAGPTGDTEQLRLALRDYRETAERLLRL